MTDIFISTYPFGKYNRRPLELLEEAGLTFTLNPHNRKLKADELARLAADCRVLIAGTEQLQPLIETSTRLEMISRVGIGLDSVPLELCRTKRIEVSYTPDAVTPAVSEITIGVMLSLLRHINSADSALRRGEWQRPVGRRIGGLTVGIVGLGRVGSLLAAQLLPFQPAAIIACDSIDVSAAVNSLNQKAGRPLVRQAAYHQLLADSDIISFHVPLTAQTRNMLDARALKLCRKDAVVLNFARGGIINEEALLEFLKANPAASAGLDVFEHEPYHGPLAALPNTLLTQHMGSCSFDCRENMETEAAHEALRYLTGQPRQQTVPPEEYLYQKQPD